MIEIEFDRGSFRDPASRVFYFENEVFRGLSPAAAEEWEILSQKAFFKRLVHEGQVVATETVADRFNGEDPHSRPWSRILRHARIPFISYPYEWTFAMLKEAALLQLAITLEALREGFVLKDASVFNIQWLNLRPVFVDIPSFERFTPGETWVGYRQFCQMYLYPLMLQAYKNFPFRGVLMGNIEGISPAAFLALMSPWDYLRKGVFLHGYLQAKFQARFAAADKNYRAEMQAQNFGPDLVTRNIQNLMKTVEGLKWRAPLSEWSSYTADNSYGVEEKAHKTAFIESVLSTRFWNLVWDAGCNTGEFSRIAAAHSKIVVAMDSDETVVEQLSKQARADGILNILPLVVDMARPSPSLGWRSRERKDLPARGRPDLVLCLALIHHLSISENIPIAEILEWLAELGGHVIIEFVSKEDPMVKRLLRNRKDVFGDYGIDSFESVLKELFFVEKKRRLRNETRTLYFARPKPGR